MSTVLYTCSMIHYSHLLLCKSPEFRNIKSSINGQRNRGLVKSAVPTYIPSIIMGPAISRPTLIKSWPAFPSQNHILANYYVIFWWHQYRYGPNLEVHGTHLLFDAEIKVNGYDWSWLVSGVLGGVWPSIFECILKDRVCFGKRSLNITRNLIIHCQLLWMCTSRDASKSSRNGIHR